MRPRDACLPLLLVSFFAPLRAQVPKNNLDVQHPPSRSSVAASMDVKRDRCFRAVLENDRIRVFKVDVPGLQSTSLDYHYHDYVLVSLGKSNIEVAGNGIRYPMQMEDGEMQVLKGGASHRITNLSGSPLHLVEMEVMGEVHPERPICGLGGHACTEGIFGRNEAGSYNQSTLFETDTVKLARVQLGAGGLLRAPSRSLPHFGFSQTPHCGNLRLAHVAASCTSFPAMPNGIQGESHTPLRTSTRRTCNS
jgi:hypothetical protein